MYGAGTFSMAEITGHALADLSAQAFAFRAELCRFAPSVLLSFLAMQPLNPEMNTPFR